VHRRLDVSTHTRSAYRIDQVVVARVEQVFPYGVFVRLTDGTRAYVHRRELTLAGNLDPRYAVTEGQEIRAVVIALAEPGRNLELSVRRAEPDPWDTFVQSFQIRDTVTATVKSLSPKGAFVQIAPGVDGFVPLRELAPWPLDQPHDLLWVGDHVEAMITHLDRRTRRLRLSVRRQIEHQASVRAVLGFLYERDGLEEDLPGEEGSEPVEEEPACVDLAIVERMGSILVVDDHDEVREPLVKWLCRLGFATEGTRSTTEALACLKERHYGLALVDLDLSGQDGLELIQALVKVTPDTWVVVMSTPAWIVQRSEELAALGVVDAFAKPLNLDEIRQTLIRLGQGEMSGALRPPVTGSGGPEIPGLFRQLEVTVRTGPSLAVQLETGLKELVYVTRAEEGLVFHLDPDSQQVSIVAQAGELPLNQGIMYILRESPVKDVIREHGEVFETYVSFRTRRRFEKLLALLSFESCVGVPISAGGEVHHALFLFHRKPDAFSIYRLRDARAMAMLFGVALESQALERCIRSASPIFLSGQLAAGLGHEVYNKMSGLEIQVRNLRADCERLGAASEPFDLADLSRATDQLLDVALDLKDTVKLFQELIQAECERAVDVNEVLQRAVQLLRPTSRRHRVRINLDLAPDLAPITGSAVRLQQVFANLMLNAVQQIAHKMERWTDGRGTLLVTSTRETAGERPIQVRFADNGPGIHHQLWESVFALGFSTRPGGTGLGLFIARSLVESMGGRVVVERSVVPIGTTFLVELPEG
jgi:signal transduction histidine kinase/predicted RNA-binding protein with RPS1 domain/ActR/RegA family two-component response regulator